MRRRLVVMFALAVFALLLLPAAALGWANGTGGAGGFGTHDWILQEADRLAAQNDAGWVDLDVALPHTDDPDTVFHDFYYHVYDTTGGDVYGGAPKKVALYYASKDISSTDPLDAFLANGGALIAQQPAQKGRDAAAVLDVAGGRGTMISVGPYDAAVIHGDPGQNGERMYDVYWSDGERFNFAIARDALVAIDAARSMYCAGVE